MSSKQQILDEYVKKYSNLASQGSKAWLDGRKFSIGGSEMSIITGDSPYKSVRALIEQHLGLTHFKGNINTYWGSILEDFVTHIMEEKWGVEIHELGSLPGVVSGQRYSPDGLLYLPWLKKIILLEIKNAARRLTNGRVPTMYKPQIFAGMDTIQIADMAMFVDVMFRRCSPDQFDFGIGYDHSFHGKKKVDKPIALCMLVLYMPHDSKHRDEVDKTCNRLKDEYGRGIDEYLDLGICTPGDLERVLCFAAGKKLNVEFSSLYETPMTFKTLADDAVLRHSDMKNRVIGIMPVKMFKFNISPVQRHDWRKMRKLKDAKGDSYVHLYEEKIKEVLDIIKRLDPLSPKEQVDELDKLWPPKEVPKVSDSIADDLIASMM